MNDTKTLDELLDKKNWYYGEDSVSVYAGPACAGHDKAIVEAAAELAELRDKLTNAEINFQQMCEAETDWKNENAQLRACKDEARKVMLAWHTTAGAEWLEKYPEETK